MHDGDRENKMYNVLSIITNLKISFKNDQFNTVESDPQ